MSSIAIDPSLWMLELLEVGDDHARVLARDVARGSRRPRPLCARALEDDQVVDRGRSSRSSVERVPGLAASGATIRRWTMCWLAYRRCSRTTTPPPPGRDGRDAVRVVLHPGERRALPGGRRRPGSPSWASPSTSTASPSRSTIWDHPFWRQNALDDLGAYCEFVRSSGSAAWESRWTSCPGREDRIANVLDRHDFDYVVGSVHFHPATGAVDHDAYDVWEEIDDPDKVWALYFETFAEAIRTGLFDICAHPDLVKVWGGQRPEPARDPRFSLRARDRGDRRDRRSPSRSRRRACASRSASSTLRPVSPRCAWTPARSSRCPPTPTCPSTSATSTSARSRRCVAGESSELGVFEGRERRMEELG